MVTRPSGLTSLGTASFGNVKLGTSFLEPDTNDVRKPFYFGSKLAAAALVRLGCE